MEKSIYWQFYELEKEHWWFKGMYAMCRDQLRYNLPLKPENTGGVILDIGCGTGAWTENLRGYGKVIGLDKAAEALEICRGRGLKDLILSDAEVLPLADSSCDIVTALGLIEHIDNDYNLLKEMRRVLKPGGCGLLLTSAYRFLWGRHDNLVHHKRRYTKKLLETKIEKAGLEIIKISYVNTFLFFPILLARTIERIFSQGKDKEQKISRDLFKPPAVINQFFYGLLRFESRLLKRISMPFGVGLLVFFRKNSR